MRLPALARPRQLKRPDGLTLITLVLAAMVLMPVLVLALAWLGDETETWRHLADTVLADLLANTLFLVVGVGLGVFFLGVSLAWLVATTEFPGRRFFDWALLLPLAVPAYVLAFLVLDLLDYAGPVQGFLREHLPGFTGGSARQTWLVVATFSLVFYPYVYMLARAAFMVQGRTLMEQARILGLGPGSAFLRVALPMARPAIAAGVALALMETLADFGAVAVFNFDTFTTAIYNSWYGLFNLNVAAQLASLLLLFVLLTLVLEQAGRGRARYDQHGGQQMNRSRPGGVRRWLITAYAGGVFAIAFLIPVGRLLFHVVDTAWQDLDERYLGLVVRTLSLAGGAAFATVALAILLGYVRRTRRHWLVHGAIRGATVGYAMPGSVLAVGIMLSFAAMDRWLNLALGIGPVLVGGLVALVMAYVVRFLAVAFAPVDAAFEQVRPRLIEAARTLGATPRDAVRRVYVPLLTPGIVAAFLLVLIDVMKEMPATLLLRPFGWDTLAVRIFEMTVEGEWARAALPSLTLVLVGLLPVYLLMRRIR